jgi:hypothetical protein
MVADTIDGRDANYLARKCGFFSSRQTIAFVRAFFAATESAAQRHFNPFGQRREVGFTVKRRENGAAHESSAAKRGQDRTGKPLYRYATAIDKAARAPVDRQRRLIAELNGVGLS